MKRLNICIFSLFFYLIEKFLKFLHMVENGAPMNRVWKGSIRKRK